MSLSNLKANLEKGDVKSDNMKVKIALTSIRKGFSEVIKTVRAYNRAIEVIGVCKSPILPNPKILEISSHTLLSFPEAEALYNLSQEYNIDIEFLIRFVVHSGLGAEDIIRVLRREGEVY